ncbi:DUF58 domain-containing protein [Xanthomonas sp. XNM01]|uniref:DUF58 domain-containing protein n=1 Tax=Xanthomonas sp. XNM01 TaxID=2769289 RepID=UPI0017816D43|nr:DUF58 domain-containing protein [Xanthomonas sp. XNM01]MBD9368713.1 DUF58 domain-containing protein [Xanthomonas sp. XNM01]
MPGALHRLGDALQALERPRQPEALPVAIGRRRVYVLPTRFGLFFAVLVMGMLLGALNYNNNPALLLALLLGASALASLIGTHLQLSGLRVEAVSAEPVAAGDALRLRLSVSASDARARRGLRIALGTSATHLNLAPGEHAEATLDVPTVRRGLMPTGRLQLSSTQPLGLARAWARTWPRHALLVYPRAETAAPPLPDTAADGSHSRVDALGDDPHQLRAYRQGDAPRAIAWKHSARRDQLVVREYERSHGEDIVLDWHALPPLPHEQRISRLAHWVDQAERLGLRYRLRLPGTPALGPATGSEHRHACLRALALMPHG